MGAEACVNEIATASVISNVFNGRNGFTLGVLYLGSGAQQKTKKRGKEERSEQTGEEGPRCAQQCSLQRRSPQGGRAEETAGRQPFDL